MLVRALGHHGAAVSESQERSPTMATYRHGCASSIARTKPRSAAYQFHATSLAAPAADESTGQTRRAFSSRVRMSNLPALGVTTR